MQRARSARGSGCTPRSPPVTVTTVVSGETVITRFGAVHTAPVFDTTMGPCAVDSFFTNGLELHDLGAVIPNTVGTGPRATEIGRLVTRPYKISSYVLSRFGGALRPYFSIL